MVLVSLEVKACIAAPLAQWRFHLRFFFHEHLLADCEISLFKVKVFGWPGRELNLWTRPNEITKSKETIVYNNWKLTNAPFFIYFPLRPTIQYTECIKLKKSKFAKITKLITSAFFSSDSCYSHFLLLVQYKQIIEKQEGTRWSKNLDAPGVFNGILSAVYMKALSRINILITEQKLDAWKHSLMHKDAL